MIFDPEFEKVLRWEIDGVQPVDRVLFFDNENNVRVAHYHDDYAEDGTILIEARNRLLTRGVLKAVVYVNCRYQGSAAGYGLRTTVVEYLPDKSWNTISHKPQPSIFDKRPEVRAVEIAKDLMKEPEK